MRILLLDLGAQWRGGQVQTALLARELAAGGDEVAVLARRGGPLHGRLVRDGPPVVPIRPGGEAHPLALLDVARAVRDLAPDVIHAGDARGHGVAVWSGAARRRPLVVHRRVVFAPGRDLFSRRKYAAADGFLAISTAVARALKAAGVPERRIVIVPDGLPPAAFMRGQPPVAPPLRLVHVGGFDGKKGQDTAVEILARLVARQVDARLTFLGDGSRRDEIARLAAARAVAPRCEFAGMVDDVSTRLAGAHGLLLTSSSEGGSLAVVEAMAAGCAVFCHDIEGAGEIVREAGAGRLIQGLDPDVWADALVARLAVPEAARRADIEAGRAFAATRTLAHTARLVRCELERAVRSFARLPEGA